jgi:hypothetical protein
MTALRFATYAARRYGIHTAASWLWSYATGRWPD